MYHLLVDLVVYSSIWNEYGFELSCWRGVGIRKAIWSSSFMHPLLQTSTPFPNYSHISHIERYWSHLLLFTCDSWFYKFETENRFRKSCRRLLQRFVHFENQKFLIISKNVFYHRCFKLRVHWYHRIFNFSIF